MQRIRIGNDIRLNLTLRGPRTYDRANIKQLKCYFINTSMLDYSPVDCNHCCYPCDKHVHGCGYMTNMCGHPKYHVLPHCCHHDCCHNDFYCSHDFRCMLDPHGCNPAAGPGILPPKYRKPYDAVNCCACDDFTYLAYSRVLPKANAIQCYFPAKDQVFCGIYKLIIQAIVYEPGWGRTDLHTYTMDYGEVIELVDDNTGASGDITVDVDTDDMDNKNIVAIRIKSKDLAMYGDTKLNLGEKDIRDHKYSIEVDLENGSTVEYSPSNWPYESIEFTPTKSDVIEIDQNTGTIHSFQHDETISTTVVATAKNNGVKASFNVTVIGGNYDFIGYLPVRPFSKEMEDDYKYHFDRDDQGFESDDQENITKVGVGHVDTNFLTKSKDLSKGVTVENDIDGQYLWIVTRRPIQYAANINAGVDSNMIPTFTIPLTTPQKKYNDEKYYYCCPNPIKANKAHGGATIYVKTKNN